MGLFKNIKIRFVIKKKIHDRYKPFFISLKKNLSSTVILVIMVVIETFVSLYLKKNI